MKLRSLIIIAITFLSIVASGVVVAKWYENTNVVKKAPAEKPIAVKKIDPQLLAQFTARCKQFDVNQKELLIIGKLNIIDGADSTQNIAHATYVMSKRGHEFYFKLGQTETINAAGLYAYINHQLKQVMVSAQKDVEMPAIMPNTAQLLKNLSSEGYELNYKHTETADTYELSNPYHLSCKTYALSFNTENQQPERLYARLTNINELEDAKKDKQLELQINKWSNKANLDHYLSDLAVKKVNGKWELATDYQHYQLIVL